MIPHHAGGCNPKTLREIERCNQRGGRMLSIVDLIEAGTLSRELAAYALAAIGRGASFLSARGRRGGQDHGDVRAAQLRAAATWNLRPPMAWRRSPRG